MVCERTRERSLSVSLSPFITQREPALSCAPQTEQGQRRGAACLSLLDSSPACHAPLLLDRFESSVFHSGTHPRGLTHSLTHSLPPCPRPRVACPTSACSLPLALHSAKQPNSYTSLWFSTYLWGQIFLRSMHSTPLFDGSSVKLFGACWSPRVKRREGGRGCHSAGVSCVSCFFLHALMIPT